MRSVFFIILFILFFGGKIFAQIPVDTVFKYSRLDTSYVYDNNKITLIPTTNIKMQVPESFNIVPEIPGLVNPITATSYEFKEYVGTSYIMLDEAMKKQNFEAQGVKLLEKQDFITNTGITGLLYRFEIYIDGVRYERIMLLAGDYHNTMWINVNFLYDFKSVVETLILKSLKTLTFNTI